MSTRKPNKPVVTALVVLGLLGQAASATEVVVVNGAEAAALARESEMLFRSEMKDYVRSLNDSLKATLDQDLKRIAAPQLRLAHTDLRTRG